MNKQLHFQYAQSNASANEREKYSNEAYFVRTNQKI